MAQHKTDNVVSQALRDYVKGELTTKEIARKYNVSQSTLTVWASNAGIKLRVRGRRRMDEPTTQQKEILSLAEVYTLEYVGEQFGMKKQGIQRIVKRWQNWMKPKHPPYKPGDIILWRGQQLTVLSAGLHSGMVTDAKGKTMRSFPWNHSGILPKKVGVNPKYASDGNAVAL